jgi:hypothetical protein
VKKALNILEERQSEEGVNFRVKMKCGDECLWYTSDHEIELIL